MRTARVIAALGVAAFVATHHRELAAQRGSTALLSALTWFDRSGKELGTVGPVANHGNVELSPDGRQAAVTVLNTSLGTRDIWLYSLAGGERRRFTTSDADENWAIWSRDGRRIIFNSTRNGPARLDLFESPAMAGTMATMLLENGMWPLSWAPDGRHILFVVNSARTGNDVMVLPLFGDRKPFVFAQSEEAENWATFSPDGRWVAFSSTETGAAEVWVAAFPPTPAGMAAKRRVSSEGGSQARWSRDGKEIFFIARDRSLMVAAVDGAGAILQVGARRKLFEPRFFFLDSHGFDVTGDGQRFLVNTLVVSPASPARIAGVGTGA